MIQSRLRLFFWPIMLLAIIFTACNRKMETAAVKSTAPSSPTAGAPRAEMLPQVPNQMQVPRQVALETPIKFEDAYFDYNKWLIRDEAKNVLEENAKLLKERPDMKIAVEGHCDERGTAEYNLVLGVRRAEAVKRYLIALGVEPSQITTISYGKEKRFCTEHNETCYQQNRRGHFFSLTAR